MNARSCAAACAQLDGTAEGGTAFTVESSPTRTAYAQEFMSEAQPAEDLDEKSYGGQVVTASEVSHRWCEVSPKIDLPTTVTRPGRGAGGDPTNTTTRQSTETARQRVRRTTLHTPASKQELAL